MNEWYGVVEKHFGIRCYFSEKSPDHFTTFRAYKEIIFHIELRLLNRVPFGLPSIRVQVWSYGINEYEYVLRVTIPTL